MSRTAELLARIKADPGLEEFCVSQGIDLLVLFGSTVTDPATARDVDLAYLAAGDVSQLDVINAFDERYGDGIDLMDLRRANPIARWEALGPGKILAERVPGTFATQQMAAYGEWNDTREFRELALQVMSQ
ncbi:hypothetical protein SAMN02745244_01350 [Tessaracoccus bendigoensis DSM 12906]|uniref:Polymerase beta nucleotidyltransferase domain-containing protein n=1 Tax=Tessaracoccus bendigoensis DSM 12906 TaxID=1123357 RepID=A0A1M6F5F9_9ACTN|nr:nucleotidyltransferase domain-containing protein [Tessaracoccus bendigoensis]SHI92910.1 hypothetical protein SAMN02745244_01350 [Tessaracoccus bendigoensis DSM 12906]